MSELDVKEDAKKEVVAQIKAEIETLKNEVRLLANNVRLKYEYRTVKCEVVRDWKKKILRFIRTDTQEVAKERALTVEELQEKLPLENK